MHGDIRSQQWNTYLISSRMLFKNLLTRRPGLTDRSEPLPTNNRSHAVSEKCVWDIGLLLKRSDRTCHWYTVICASRLITRESVSHFSTGTFCKMRLFSNTKLKRQFGQFALSSCAYAIMKRRGILTIICYHVTSD